MFKNAIYSTLGFALNVTICKSLHFALLHLDILMDYIINCITHETCKVNCARLCTIEHMLHIQVWKILQFAVFVAPKLLNLFFKKHGLAHENVQVIAHCTFWICNSAIYCTTFWKFILHFMNIPMCKILHFAVQYFKSAHPHIIWNLHFHFTLRIWLKYIAKHGFLVVWHSFQVYCSCSILIQTRDQFIRFLVSLTLEKFWDTQD